jgi:phenolic acid decarboxylase
MSSSYNSNIGGRGVKDLEARTVRLVEGVIRASWVGPTGSGFSHVINRCRADYRIEVVDSFATITFVEDRGRDVETVIACGPEALPAGFAARRN